MEEFGNTILGKLHKLANIKNKSIFLAFIENGNKICRILRKVPSSPEDSF